MSEVAEYTDGTVRAPPAEAVVRGEVRVGISGWSYPVWRSDDDAKGYAPFDAMALAERVGERQADSAHA
jgi:hypothetical protein